MNHVGEAEKCVEACEAQARANATQVALVNAALAVAHELAALRETIEALTVSTVDAGNGAV